MTKHKQPADHPKETAQPAESEDSRLDEALDESFPASDPIAIDVDEPRHSPGKGVTPGGKKRH